MTISNLLGGWLPDVVDREHAPPPSRRPSRGPSRARNFSLVFRGTRHGTPRLARDGHGTEGGIPRTARRPSTTVAFRRSGSDAGRWDQRRAGLRAAGV